MYSMLGSWGLNVIITAFLDNFLWFVIARMTLGIFQAGFVPCILVYISSFYTKEETATRLACVFSFAAISQSFSELISDYVSQADHLHGLSGWQWYYITEGLNGLLMGIATLLYLPSFPETCNFLNPADRVLAVARGRDGYDKEESSLANRKPHLQTRRPQFRFNYMHFIDIVQDLRIWLLSVCYLFIAAASDLLIVATPEISARAFGIARTCVNNCTVAGAEEELDLRSGIPLVLEVTSILPYGLAMAAAYFTAIRSDATGDRATHAMAPLGLAIFGFVFMGVFSNQDQPVRYFFGVLPTVVGTICGVPSVLAYAMEHASGDTQRATVAGVVIGLGHSLGLVVSALFQLMHSSPTVVDSSVDWASAITLGVSCVCLLGVQRLNDAEKDNNWGKAPGLRRLLNDEDEAKAWDIELNDVGDFVKSGKIGSTEYGSMGDEAAWESSDEI
ncbi:hypothetical protein HDU91_000261 [Kappamyces sp. JEL0680]|nr:hypothetical protein HDU91_000261 [Kappamyces sp. JEL0680]